MALNSMQEIFEKAASRSIPFWRVVLETDMEERQVTEEQSMEKMRAAWHAMLESVVSYQGDQRSRSGLVGGDGARCGVTPRRILHTAAPMCRRSLLRPSA